jgi:hypothetical protein
LAFDFARDGVAEPGNRSVNRVEPEHGSDEVRITRHDRIDDGFDIDGLLIVGADIRHRN